MLIYIFDMESSLANSLASRVISLEQNIIFRKWDMDLDPEKELETYGHILGGMIISGSAKNVNSTKSKIPSIPHQFMKAGIPTLAICYGMQYLTEVLGGRVQQTRFSSRYI